MCPSTKYEVSGPSCLKIFPAYLSQEKQLLLQHTDATMHHAVPCLKWPGKRLQRSSVQNLEPKETFHYLLSWRFYHRKQASRQWRTMSMPSCYLWGKLTTLNIPYTLPPKLLQEVPMIQRHTTLLDRWRGGKKQETTMKSQIGWITNCSLEQKLWGMGEV